MPILNWASEQNALCGILQLKQEPNGVWVRVLASLAEPLQAQEVIRLYLLYGAGNPPRKVTLIPTAQCDAEVEGHFPLPSGFDGGVIVCLDTQSGYERILAAAHTGTPYGVDDFFHLKPSPKSSLPLPEEIPENSPLIRAKQALQQRKEETGAQNAQGAPAFYLRCLTAFAKAGELVKLPLPPPFTWYRVSSPIPPTRLSAMKHLLLHPRTLEIFGKCGYYLLGIAEGESQIALALPDTGGAPPFPLSDDCRTFFTSGNQRFYAVGIALLPDGQYFFPPPVA